MKWHQPKLVVAWSGQVARCRVEVGGNGSLLERVPALDLRCDADACPAHRDRKCRHPGKHTLASMIDAFHGIGCDLFVCESCGRWMPWCCGMADSDECDECRES